MNENIYQRNLITKIKTLLPDAIVMKNDPTYIQGIPDLTILNGNKWATLEVKKSSSAKPRPNQSEYVEKMNNMSFSRFIFPENESEVLNELQQALSTRRSTRTVRGK